MNISSPLKGSFERLRKAFVQKYSIAQISQWNNPGQYVVGLGNNNQSFCYWVEYKTKNLGDIRGANASKFGLYYSTDDKVFKATKKYYDSDANKAFIIIKKELISLIDRTLKLQKFTDLSSKISGMFKYKIMYLYNPSIMLPCFVLDDLIHFEDSLNLIKSKTYEDAQLNLLNYYIKHESKYSPRDFIWKLYRQYGKADLSYDLAADAKEEQKIKDYLNKIGPKQLNNPLPKPSNKKRFSKITVFQRDNNVALYALQQANFRCEFNKEHPTFMRKKSHVPYLEEHHLIPMCFQNRKRFRNINLDIPENVVMLCSNCHNEIHYGENYKILLKQLYNARIKALNKENIHISFDELVNLYERINKKKDI